MQLALIGVGRVGGTIVDSLTAYDRLLDDGFVAGSVVVDTASADVASLRAVPRANRIVVGSAYPCREGVDGDNELGASIAAEDIDVVLGGVDCLPSHRVDAFLVVASLAGGTGGGGAPVVARELRRLFSRPVYGLGVLPPPDADDATARRTVRSLVTFVREVDNLLLVESERTRQGVDVSALSRRLATLFGTAWPAGQPPLSGHTPTDTSPDETGGDLGVVLASGSLSVLGHAATTPPRRRLVERMWSHPNRSASSPTAADVVSVVREAVVADGEGSSQSSQTAVPRAERAWFVLGRPTRTRSQPASAGGTDHVSHGRRWLRAETGASTVCGRAVWTDAEQLTVTVLLSGVRDIPRLTALWERAAASSRGDTADGQQTRTDPAPSGWRDRTFDPLF